VRILGDVFRSYLYSSAIGDGKRYLLDAQNNSNKKFGNHERTGRSLGSDRFIEMAESLLDRNLKKKKPGPKVIGDDD